REVLIQALELEGIPADAEAEAQAAAREVVDLGRLLREEGGLALGHDDDFGRELEARRYRAQVGEEHQWLVDKGLVVESGAPTRRPVFRVRAQDMVKRDQVVVAEAFDRLGEIAGRDRLPHL